MVDQPPWLDKGQPQNTPGGGSSPGHWLDAKQAEKFARFLMIRGALNRFLLGLYELAAGELARLSVDASGPEFF